MVENEINIQAEINAWMITECPRYPSGVQLQEYFGECFKLNNCREGIHCRVLWIVICGFEGGDSGSQRLQVVDWAGSERVDGVSMDSLGD